MTFPRRPLFKNFYFAFVQFQKLEHAQKALQEHRFPEIKGHVCRALPYNMQSSFLGTVPTNGKKEAGSDPQKQIFVKNCPKYWTHEDLYEQFSPFGEITSAKVSISASYESRGYGFIEFTSTDGAKKAVAEMNDKEIELPAPVGDRESGSEEARETCKLSVCHFEPKRTRIQ